MENRPIVSKRRYLLAFLIGTSIFLFGFGLTYTLSYGELKRVVDLQNPLSYKIFEDKLQYSLFDKDLCSEQAYLKISRDLAFHGSLIGELENNLGKDNEDVLFRKKFYSLVLLEHFELVNLQNEKCGSNLNQINTILFFYSNEEEDIENSEKIGELLSIIAERNKDRLVVYSFDVNLDSDIIRSLKNKYDVTTPYLIIINEQERFAQIDDIDQVEVVLK